MPAARPTRYEIASGATLYAGAAPGPFDEVRARIEAAPENSWVQLNKNTYRSAWAPGYTRNADPHDYNTQFYAPSNPARGIGAWASVGWVRGTMVSVGGGHANSFSAEAYMFKLSTGMWESAYYDTMVKILGPSYYRPVDGSLSFLSSHCYNNNQGLPILNRFYTGGGASVGVAQPLMLWDGDTGVRALGGMTLDLTLAGQAYVAGSTGSNVHYGPDLDFDRPGANAWKARDWGDGRCPTFAGMMERKESGAVYAVENGHDVLYLMANGMGFRAEFVDDNPANDIVTQVAGPQNGVDTNGGMAYDPVRKLWLILTGGPTATQRAFFIDLSLPISLSRPWGRIVNFVGEDQEGFLGPQFNKSSGCTYDKNLGCFVIWQVGRQPFLLYPPAGTVTGTGWTIVKPMMDQGTPAPSETRETYDLDLGAIGKFRYVPEIDCHVGICSELLADGDVWALKLTGWTRPAG